MSVPPENRRVVIATMLAAARGHAETADAIAGGIVPLIEQWTGRTPDDQDIADAVFNGADFDAFLAKYLPPERRQ